MRLYRVAAGLLLFSFPAASACSDGASDVQATTPAAGAGGAKAGGGAGATAGKGTTAGTGGRAGDGGASGGAAGTKAAGGCTLDADCKLVATVPAGCAKGKCSAGVCAFSSVDADGDGHATSACKPADTSVIVELGDDCDDTNAKVFPGGWDGPAADGNEDACNDGIDQDCSGKADDGKSKAGGTCTCTPGDVRVCSETSDGKTIVFPVVAPGATPLGECRRGAQTCLAGGTFGPCTGVIVPVKEECNDKDDDCDGKIDLAGDVVPTDAPSWFYDQDDDLHADKTAQEVKSCDAPTTGPCADQTKCPASDAITGKTHWRVGLPKDDCVDTDGGVYPGATEVCNGKDDDCNEGTPDATATGVATWFWDGDGDGYVADSEIATAKKACADPGLDTANCRGTGATCVGKWLLDSARKAGSDCDDSRADTFPGAWDGPAGRSWGLDPDGLEMKIWGIPSIGGTPPGAQGLPYPKDDLLATKRAKTLGLDWFETGPLPTRKTNVAVELNGTIVAPETGTYTFEVAMNDDHLFVTLGTEILFNVGCCVFSPGDAPRTKTVEMVAGQATALHIDLVQFTGPSGLLMLWSGPGVPRQTIGARSPVAIAGQPDRCDGRRQNCNAGLPDVTTESGYACGGECFPGETSACGAGYYQAYVPASACRIGQRVCQANGKWGACAGGVEPVAEVCGNGQDDDCNGQIDEGTPTAYPDADGDGYGVSAGSKPGCNLGAGWANQGGDECAPNDPTRNPGKAEVCDGVDNNCANGADEGFSVGSDCDVDNRTQGACAGGGRRECQAASGSVCVKKHPDINVDAFRTTSFNGNWNWNCDADVQTDHFPLYRWPTCDFAHAAAEDNECADIKDATDCGQKIVFVQCPSPPEACGQPVQVHRCFWIDLPPGSPVADHCVLNKTHFKTDTMGCK